MPCVHWTRPCDLMCGACRSVRIAALEEAAHLIEIRARQDYQCHKKTLLAAAEAVRALANKEPSDV